ncbi:MAG: hypothetical protein IJO65_13485 [Lachnospiraceae bacterium]|nr:hypothetical protein [Lachnospiraceae bacterium]
MILSDIGSWASIIGLAITILTFFLAANVNKKVNGILKSKNDKTYFNKKVVVAISDLSNLLEIAEEGKTDILYSTKQYSKINSAIELVNSSWEVLLPYENKLTKKIKNSSWNRKFEKIHNMYNNRIIKNTNEVITFLNEFITFLEKEQDNNE